MADCNWMRRSDTRDPCVILMSRESHDCQLTQCANFAMIFGRRWCEARSSENPFNRNCKHYVKG